MLIPGNTISSRLAYFLGILLVSASFYLFFFTSYNLSTHIISPPHSEKLPHSSLPYSSNEVTDDVFDFPPLDSPAVRAVCDSTKWNPEVVFTCDNAFGGVGNVRSSILHCVRLAISAGASMVVPRIILRGDKDITIIKTGPRTGMDHMFDVEHFIDSLKLSCPQLVLYRFVVDVPNRAHAIGPVDFLPAAEEAELEHPELWRGVFFEWLKNVGNATMETPVLVDLVRMYLSYPIHSDGEEFAASFGGMLKFRKDVRILATTVLRAMMAIYNLDRDISPPILQNRFFGAHLRTEVDAMKAWPVEWGWKYQSYELQSECFLKKMAETNLTLIYVASGSETEISRFAEDAKAYKLTHKFMVLDKKDTRYLKTLTWDQQALVDFLVMTKSSTFVGIDHSSFAWNIALKRHLLSERKEGYLDGPEIMNDELSVVFGDPKTFPFYARSLWP